MEEFDEEIPGMRDKGSCWLEEGYSRRFVKRSRVLRKDMLWLMRVRLLGSHSFPPMVLSPCTNLTGHLGSDRSSTNFMYIRGGRMKVQMVMREPPIRLRIFPKLGMVMPIRI